MFDQRRRRWAYICITFVQCWINVEDVGPTLYKCYTNVLCLLGVAIAENTRRWPMSFKCWASGTTTDSVLNRHWPLFAENLLVSNTLQKTKGSKCLLFKLLPFAVAEKTQRHIALTSFILSQRSFNVSYLRWLKAFFVNLRSF